MTDRVAFHPKAFLSRKRNVKFGVSTRSKIIEVLEHEPASAKIIAEEAGLGYSNVMHHLRLLEAEKIVRREGGKPYVWKLTGIGQMRLVDIKV
jgi:DNA-binding transcriptional ArsR family regulator